MKPTKIKHPIFPELLQIKGTQAYAHPDVKFGKDVMVPKSSTALFWRGTFYGGTFFGGTFYGGTFYGGTFFGGAFEGGTFEGGAFYGGTFYGGTFFGGTFFGGTFYVGAFYGGAFKGGAFYGGAFYGGTFYGGTFYGGFFYEGAFRGGIWREGYLSLQIQGSEDFLNSPDGKVIAIGCYEKTPEEWLKEYEEVGIENKYSEKQIKEYKGYIKQFQKLMK